MAKKIQMENGHEPPGWNPKSGKFCRGKGLEPADRRRPNQILRLGRAKNVMKFLLTNSITDVIFCKIANVIVKDNA
jgi:hypothetical protein